MLPIFLVQIQGPNLVVLYDSSNFCRQQQTIQANGTIEDLQWDKMKRIMQHFSKLLEEQFVRFVCQK